MSVSASDHISIWPSFFPPTFDPPHNGKGGHPKPYFLLYIYENIIQIVKNVAIINSEVAHYCL